MRCTLGHVSLLFCSLLLSITGYSQSSEPILTSKLVCQFSGEQSPGNPAYNKDESCTIPDVALLDKTFRQGNFVGSGGGATSRATSADIPPGLEVHAEGGYYWSTDNPRLSGDVFSIHLYCGPGAPGQPGCNVKVVVVAHYRIVPVNMGSEPPRAGGNGAAQNVSPRGQTPTQSSSASSGETRKSADTAKDTSTLLGMPVDKALAFVFGVTFVVILLLIAIFDRKPTPLAIFIYRVVLALAAAGIGAVLPGLIDVNINPIVRAGGAIALFVLVYMFKPAELLVQDPEPEPRRP